MIFAEPWLLLAFLVLPLLWWLLRASPPAPRTQSFPALRLLADLEATAESPERTPPWLMALRILALACLILGLANPILNPRRGMAGAGPLLIVLDNGWAAAGDWPDRAATARAAIQAADRSDRPVALLMTAAEIDGRMPAILGPMAARDALARLAAVEPQAWAPDRAADTRALDGWRHAASSVLFIDDGITAPHDEAAFRAALARVGSVTDARALGTAALLQAPEERDGALLIRLAAVPQPVARHFAVLAQGSTGNTLNRIALDLPAGQAEVSAPLGLPTMLANSVTKLLMAGAPSVGGTLLLDRQWRHRIVGLASTAGTNADAPLVGPLFYLNRALGPDVDIRRGGLMDLLSQPLSVLILSDRPLTSPDEVAAVTRFVRQGGLLIRFGGPMTGETADTLLPVHLLRQDRSLGGALSWNKPEPLAPFPATSPFAGLPIPKDVSVSRQLLADPASLTGVNVWATLADGTPLVSSAPMGQGRIVLFHVTADADWSSLPLSGLFPDMLDRLIHLASGTGDGDPKARLAPYSIMNGFGEMNAPSAAASPIEADQLATTQPSPRTPPGLYGTAGDRHALNLGPSLPAPTSAGPVPGSTPGGLSGRLAERDLGPMLTALAIALLILDLLASLLLRGALRWHRKANVTLALVLGLSLVAAYPAHSAETVPQAALQTSLGYVVTGNSSVDRLSRDGLASLSDFVSSRSAAVLGPPVGVVPGRDDLSLYPLLYWPILPGGAAPTGASTAALNQFMENGGIILIDTEGSDVGAPGSGSGLQPGAAQALRQAVAGLDIPPLTPLTSRHVLAHSFYLLRDFPGRYDGAPIWVTQTPEASNDGVSPIIIGANDWAAAWDMNQDGSFPYSTMPGSDQQRLYAYRFGMNLVMYALTGTYKGDQVHVPAILERLGQ
ncbi:DUF4159 domain-containing protein [Acidisoma cellulosilytica]|uniref:DUF4159 domain-containing protein n=1 Tax=Acidisoma cellulosilyticum TaxID=2802395 RepID=A0A963Z147_9PROT|nr:DUF4159 domain-containing protein [Acidisoma cellulosilyticum]MCB8880731.1 DUF4159 domain-containing protein [Acidisoma cellulosilyticum]